MPCSLSFFAGDGLGGRRLSLTCELPPSRGQRFSVRVSADARVSGAGSQTKRGVRCEKGSATTEFVPRVVKSERRFFFGSMRSDRRQPHLQRVWCLALALCLRLDVALGELAFSTSFEDDTLAPFIKSENSRYSGQAIAVTDGGLKLDVSHKHYGLAAPLSFEADGSLVIQYDLTLTEGLVCGGAYLKLLEKTTALDLTSFDDKTPFVIMFGPDKCGATDKVHFILRQRNQVSGEWAEHHLKNGPRPITDKNVHMYTAIVRPDDSIEILIDGESKFKGSLMESLEPPLTPPSEIDDPDDSKPADWVDLAKIDDPAAVKPDDWDEDAPAKIVDPSASKPDGWLDDEPNEVPDPEAVRPGDWDDEEDGVWEAPLVSNPKCEAVGCGEWEPPMIDNPDYKGKWRAPKIDNPEYKGEWKPRKIPNPTYFEVSRPAKSIPIVGAVAIEIWTTDRGIVFDNIALGHSADDAKAFAAKFYEKKALEEAAKKKKKEEKEARKLEKKLQKGNILAKIKVKFNEAADLAQANPAAAAATGLSVLVALVFFFSTSRKSRKAQEEPQESDPAPAPAQGASQDDDDDNDDNKAPRDD